MGNSFAEMMYGTAQNTSEGMGKGIPEALATGASLAMKAEELKSKRDELKQNQVKISIQQNKDVLDTLELADKTKDPNLQKMILGKALPSKVKAYGLDQTWSPDVLEALQKSPEARAKSLGLRMQLEDDILHGKKTEAQAIQDFQTAVGDPLVFAASDADRLYEAQKFQLAQAAKVQAAKVGGDRSEKRIAIQQDRLDMTVHNRVLTAIRTDPLLKGRLQQYQNLDNALATITKAKTLTPQQIQEFQQTVRRNLGITGTSGVGEREATFINTMGLNAANWQQFLTGDPVKLAKDSELVNHLKDLANVEQDNIRTQMESRINTASGGYDETLYQRRPDLKKGRDSVVKSVKDSITAPPNPNDSFQIGGMKFTRDALKKFKKENPNDPMIPQVNQLLGEQ